ncbi:uncharacterized protein LOC135129126 [Zophobas morio]|uniref:uncharacterized protein LOC135129126 n=1 Tax=Zophobas morio TaxID=2755281 RepID=UPI00308315DC
MAGAEGDDNAETFSDSNPTPEDAGNLQILLLKRDRIHDEISRFKLWFETNNYSTSASRLRVRLRDFVRIKAQFDKIHSQIEALDDATLDLEHSRTKLYFENAYYDLCADVEDAIEQKRVNTSSPAPQGNAPTSTPSPSVQLLPIVIKPFSGIYTEWLPFYNTFKTLVHDDTRLTKIQKFHHLKNSLCGDAVNAINPLTISEANYDVAWKLLKDRFENKRLIVQHHVTNLFNLPQVIKDSASSMRQLLDTFNTNLEALKSFDVEINPSDVLLIYLLTSKLDFISRRGWEESLTTNELPTKKQLIDYLTQRCHLMESMELNKSQFKTNNTYNNNQKTEPKSFSKPPQKVSTFTAAVNRNSTQSTCNFCKKSHLIYNCVTFLKLSVSERRSRVDRLKLCQNCLKPSHTSDSCKSMACKLCQLKHNTLLHSDQPSHSNDDKSLTAPETQHENYFINNATQLSNGRFQVRLTFSKCFPILRDSKEIALQRLYSSELKFAKNIMLEINYHNFIKEDINLDHMLLLGSFTEQKIESKPHHFLPHHAVSKTDGVTEKICVVFDGSVKPSVGKSINACLSTGPKIQNDISDAIIRSRTHEVAFTADICNMYHQILFQPEDRRYEKTLWWDDPVLYQARVTLAKRASNTNLLNDLTTNHINFHFIPPSAPHMGTIGEAMVKSAKSQLKRVTGIFLFNLQEMQTLQIQVETCLNSYPLTAMSKDPNDLIPLIPGHFLVGTPLTVIPEDNVTTVSTNRLSRWQQFSRTQQQFWKRWTAEHMGQLHHRPKWTKASRNSIRWTIWWSLRKTTHSRLYGPLGRVITVHPGLHGPIRVVTVRTAHDVINLQVTKLCVLPT